MPHIILHHYARSPFSEKIRLALGLKGLAYHAVTIPALMPRPELMPLTGGYRRTPVLQIGADIHCDTLAILIEVERLHPTPSLFPAGTDAIATALGQWIERAIFVPAVGLVRSVSDAPPNPAMTADRRAFFGFDIDRQAMLAQQPLFLQRLAVHIAWLTHMMQDGRDYLLGAAPGAADLAAFHPIWFIHRNADPTASTLLPGLASLRPWYDRIDALGHGHPQELTAAQARDRATAASPAALDQASSDLPGLQIGDAVSVTPDDTGRDPVHGSLLAVFRDNRGPGPHRPHGRPYQPAFPARRVRRGQIGMTATMQPYRFDDQNITWHTVDFIGARIWVLAVDQARGIADVLIRFEANTPGKLHRHVCDFSTFVLQGELRFWRPDGLFKEVRPTASHVQVAANGEPHKEGAGDQTAIVLFSFRGTTGDMIHYMDDASNVVFRLAFSDFKSALAEQVATGAAAKLAPRREPGAAPSK